MKKTRLLCLIFSFFLLLQSFVFGSYAQGGDDFDASVAHGCKTIDAQMPLYGKEKRLSTSEAAMLYEASSDTTLYSWNADVKLSPASFAKIITCMVVLENCDIQEKVTVTESALSTIKKTAHTIKLLAGEEFTVDQMLYALMVGSANDAAVVLAEHVAGSQDNFVAMMNECISELGCKDTYFVNSHGLHDDRQYTTARDVVRMVSVAMQDEQFMEYFGTTSYRIAATDQSDIRRVETTNYLRTIGTELYYDSRVTGGRTGITNDQKRSLVVTASSSGLDYIAVVMCATPTFSQDESQVKWFGSYEEAKELLELGFTNHNVYQVLYEGQIMTQFSVPNGRSSVSLGSVDSAEVTLPTGTKIEDLTFRYGITSGSLSAPVNAGDQITSVEVWFGDVCVASSPVIAMNSSVVNDGPLLQQNRYGGASKVWVVVLIVLILIGVAVALLFAARSALVSLKFVQQNIRHRRRRSGRRRTK